MLSPIMDVATPALWRVAPDGRRFNRAACQLLRNVTLFTNSARRPFDADVGLGGANFVGPGWEESPAFFAVLALFGDVSLVFAVFPPMKELRDCGSRRVIGFACPRTLTGGIITRAVYI
jgi:hypothetical protein